MTIVCMYVAMYVCGYINVHCNNQFVANYASFHINIQQLVISQLLLLRLRK